MTIREVRAKSLLRKMKKPDSWFLTSYGMNIYRGCAHNCIYCDGQSEQYQVNGDFESEIEVKVNAPKLLDKELTKITKAGKPSGYLGVVGGVSDAYQPIEQKYQLTRKVLEIITDKKFPVMVLTKSILVERDLNLIKQIHKQSGAIVAMSFSSVDDEISKIFEPGVEPPSKRLETLKKFKAAGIKCGIFLMPVVPFVTDIWAKMNEVFSAAARLKLDFIVFGGMTLKSGRQSENFYNVLNDHYPDLKTEYLMIYKGGKYGNATDQYYHSLNAPLQQLSQIHKIPLRIPILPADKQFSLSDRIVLILEQLDYLVKLRSQKSPYGYAAYNLSKLKEPIEQHLYFLRSIKGIGPKTERIIQEIIRTGTSEYYTNLMNI